MITLNQLFPSQVLVKPLRWQQIFENLPMMMGILKRMHLIIADGLSKESCIAFYLFCKEVRRLYKRSGALFASLYLKQCGTCLMTAYGGDRHVPNLLPVPVSLTRSGYPRIIPPFIRRKMYKRDDYADRLVKIWLSVFSLSRLVVKAKKFRFSDLRSIYELPVSPEEVNSFVGRMYQDIPPLVKRYLPKIDTVPLNLGLVWEPTWKALPSIPVVAVALKAMLTAKKVNIRPKPSSFSALWMEFLSFEHIRSVCRVHQKMHQVALWKPVTPFDPNNDKLIEGEEDSEQLRSFKDPLFSGRLSWLVEGGGKRRVFAIGNYVNQRLLRPFHDWLMRVLSLLQTDGTFRQEAPLDRLINKQVFYSFDLSSATDLFPLGVQAELSKILFGQAFAHTAVENCLKICSERL
jgi:hypothetical protein